MEAIESMKGKQLELLHEEIYDQVSGKMGFGEYETLIKDMLSKKILRDTGDKHYDLY